MSVVFVECLVLPCLKDGNFKDLFTALKSIDPTLEKFRKHLVATANHFTKTRQYKLAYIFQDLLQVLYIQLIHFYMLA